MKRFSIFFGFVLILSIVSTAGFAADKRAGHPRYKAELSGQAEAPPVTTNATGEAVFEPVRPGAAGKGAGGAAKSGPDNNFYSGILDKGRSTVEASGSGAGGAEKSEPAQSIYYSGILDRGKSTGEAPGSGAGGSAGEVLHYTLKVTNIQNVTAAHLHMGKKETVEGPVIVPLYSGPEKTGQFSGTLAEGTITAKDLKGPLSGKSIQDLVTMMNNGDVYVNVHTSQNPGGEIRGEVKRQ